MYRKPTHRDQYLHWDSNHFIGAKLTVYNTLAHWAKMVPHNQHVLHQELDHYRPATFQLGHWTGCNTSLNNCIEPTQFETPGTTNQLSTLTTITSTGTFLLWSSYIQSFGEKFKKVCKTKDIQVHFKGSNTVKTLLMAPKDKDHKRQKGGIIYKCKCLHTNCPEEYIGESRRRLGDRVKEHLRVPSQIHQHSSTTGHPVCPDFFNIVHREPQGITRYITEAMSIRVNDPSLNRNIGNYQLT